MKSAIRSARVAMSIPEMDLTTSTSCVALSRTASGPGGVKVIGQIKSRVLAAIIAGSFIAPLPAAAQALKGAGTCLDEYKANKPALRAAKEKKADFIAACRALPPGTPTPIAGAAPPSPAAPAGRTSDVGSYKTAGQCDDEYKQAKAALKAAKEKKKDFVAACRSLPPGSPTPINGAGAAPLPSAPSPIAPAQAPAPTNAPAPQAAPSQAPRPSATAAPGESACGNGYAHLPATHTAVQFCTDAEAKSRCPGASVVWVNTKSKIYHKAGSNTYGHTKVGAYMCESDATAEGDRPSGNGH
jgi:hypothetical protein